MEQTQWRYAAFPRPRDNRSHAASEGLGRGSDLAVTAPELTAGPGVGRVAISPGCFHEPLESGHDIADRRSTVTDRHGASELVVDVSLVIDAQRLVDR